MSYDMVDFCIGYVVGKTDFSKQHDLLECYQMFFVLKAYIENHMERAIDNEDEDEIIDFLFGLNLENIWNIFKEQSFDGLKG